MSDTDEMKPITRPTAGERGETLLSAAWLHLQDAQKAPDNATAVERVADALAEVMEVVEILDGRLDARGGEQVQQPAIPADLEALWQGSGYVAADEDTARIRAAKHAPVLRSGTDEKTIVVASEHAGWGQHVGLTLATFDDNASVLLRDIPIYDTDDDGHPIANTSIRLDWQAMFRLVTAWIAYRAQVVERHEAQRIADGEIPF